MKQRLLVTILLMVLVPLAQSQDESVNPGINDSFKNPDIEKSLGRFEVETREVFSRRHEIVDLLGLKEGMEVADVGAGTGFFARLMAKEVAPSGKVYAVEIASAFLKHIKEMAKKESIDNIELVLCDQKSTNLPAESIDLAIVCKTYHHFEFPYQTLGSIHRALRAEGLLVVIDFERVEGVSRDWVLNHVRCGKGTVTDEIRDSGFDLVDEFSLLEEDFILEFKKRD